MEGSLRELKSGPANIIIIIIIIIMIIINTIINIA